ncbi:D-2-hydroxyacid dehydrogenase [Sporosarcina siberiensis]|uniref:D-2-hydroxyacid dehydrogenase n=1 Tax=Sporosarcina siberiensis TaxID=1365606 RepID=A0ABW4SGZ9_9BACL
MKVLFTFEITNDQKMRLENKFRDVTFQYNKKGDTTDVESVEILVTYSSEVDSSLLERAKKLKWIMTASAGVEKMPLLEIAERNITLTNVRGIHKTPMAESVLAHILALRRSLPSIYSSKESKEWSRPDDSTELMGSTALILGPGSIGSEIGRLLQAFGVKTIGCNRSGRISESMDKTIVFRDLMLELPKADYVISVLPSTPETRGLLTREHFSAMKETAVFMNFGRGDLFNETFLINALKNNEIGQAVLDVFEVEPLPLENELWTLENCVISPHVSGLSSKYVERALIIFEKNLELWIESNVNLENLINLFDGY